jgi:hypothetical protein
MAVSGVLSSCEAAQRCQLDSKVEFDRALLNELASMRFVEARHRAGPTIVSSNRGPEVTAPPSA